MMLAGLGFADGLGSGTRTSASPPAYAVLASSGLVAVADTINHRVRLRPGLDGCGVGAFADGAGAGASFNAPYSLCALARRGLLVEPPGIRLHVSFKLGPGSRTVLLTQTLAELSLRSR